MRRAGLYGDDDAPTRSDCEEDRDGGDGGTAVWPCTYIIDRMPEQEHINSTAVTCASAKPQNPPRRNTYGGNDMCAKTKTELI